MQSPVGFFHPPPPHKPLHPYTEARSSMVAVRWIRKGDLTTYAFRKETVFVTGSQRRKRTYIMQKQTMPLKYRIYFKMLEHLTDP